MRWHRSIAARRAARCALPWLWGLGLLGGLGVCQAWILPIGAGTRALYLQVGAGTANGSNATVNTVSATVPAASVGSSAPVAMSSDSTVSLSFFDNYAVCNPPGQVYVGGYNRRPNGNTATATLSVTMPANLASGADLLPSSQIAWTSSANGNATADIASGSFTGASQTLAVMAANTWVENCFTYRYANSVVPAAGIYTGRATFTLSSP